MVFVPSRGFLFFYGCMGYVPWLNKYRFRPLTGISLFLYNHRTYCCLYASVFSSPHGDFSFSMIFWTVLSNSWKHSFSSPHGDFSFSMTEDFMTAITHEECFRPLTGISLFLLTLTEEEVRSALFSSPHGDFSFSIFLACHHQHNGANRFRPLTGISLFLSHLLSMSWRKLGKFSSPHGDFSFSISSSKLLPCVASVFVPSRGFLFFYNICK